MKKKFSSFRQKLRIDLPDYAHDIKGVLSTVIQVVLDPWLTFTFFDSKTKIGVGNNL